MLAQYHGQEDDRDEDDDFYHSPSAHHRSANAAGDDGGEDEDEEEEEDEDDDDEDDDDDDALRGMGLSKEERCAYCVFRLDLLFQECYKHAPICRRRLMKMPELERELELTRRTAADEDAVFMKQLARSGRSHKEAPPAEARRPSIFRKLKTPFESYLGF